MHNDPNHVVRSPHCPNDKRTCGTCAWGFLTPTGAGEGESVDKKTLTPLTGISGYRSDCGPVALFTDANGRIGAIRGERFFPGIEGNFAFERFKTNLVQIQAAV